VDRYRATGSGTPSRAPHRSWYRQHSAVSTGSSGVAGIAGTGTPLLRFARQRPIFGKPHWVPGCFVAGGVPILTPVDYLKGAVMADVDPTDSDGSIELLYRLHGRPLFRFLLRVTLGDRREAEDLLQETIFRAWRYLQDNSLDVERLLPWLYTVARRAAIDAGRARQARPTEVVLTDLNAVPTAPDDIERMLVTMTMRRGLMTLTPEHRQVLVEVFYHERSASKAAEVLGIPEGTVRSRTFYALRALRAATAGAVQER
jgi:RNA polymerase sigma-70 factor (ECF subfamily)